MSWTRHVLATGGTVLFLLLTPAEALLAQDLILVGGSVSLESAAAVAGSEPMPDEDDATQLEWTNVMQTSKITVSTMAPGQRFTLYAEATNVQNGTSQGPISLTDGAPAVDFIRDLEPSADGSSKLRYTGEATVDQGAGADTHIITFTLTTQ